MRPQQRGVPGLKAGQWVRQGLGPSGTHSILLLCALLVPDLLGGVATLPRWASLDHVLLSACGQQEPYIPQHRQGPSAVLRMKGECVDE